MIILILNDVLLFTHEFSLLCATAAALAPLGGGDFAFTWYTIDGVGGGSSTGCGFELASSIGQHDAVQVLTSGNFAVIGGFWAGAGSAPDILCSWDLDKSGYVGTSDLQKLFAQ